MSEEQIKQATEGIKNLKDGEVFEMELISDSGFEVWRKYDMLFLFEIPMYGGQPVFGRAFVPSSIKYMMEYINRP